MAERPAPRGSRKGPARRPTNLSLDPDAVARGERFGKRHGTSLSQVVTDLLQALPDADATDRSTLLPSVRRLYGVAAGGRADRDTYRAHLDRKYGGMKR